MADDRKENILKQRMAHFKQEVKSLMLARSIPPEVVKKILEVLREMEKNIMERDLYRSEGSEDLARVMDGKIDKGDRYVDDTLQEYGASEAPSWGEGEEEEEEEEGAPEQPSEREPSDRQGSEREQRPDSKRGKKGEKPREKPKPKPKPTEGRAAGGAGRAARAGKATRVIAVAVRLWPVWLVLLVIIIILGLFMFFGGGAHKAINEGGGSFPIALNYSKQEDRNLVEGVIRLRDEGTLVFASDVAKDIEWKGTDSAGAPTHDLDWRTMVTLRYLGEKWKERANGAITIQLLKSNGPDVTRRQAVMKVVGVTMGGGGEEPLDAPSAYPLGQAIGVSTIGRISNELAEACFKDSDGDQENNALVQVKWQEIASQEIIRPTYEQLQVDGKVVYEGAKVLQGLAKQAKKNPADLERYTASLASADSWYVKVGNALDNIVVNLTKVAGLKDRGTDPRTKEYAQTALGELQAVRERTRTDITTWDDEENVVVPLRTGLQVTFRAMQVANMVGWKGSEKKSCRLWKAYEARQAVRQLVLDLEQMPADPKLAESGKNWNTDLMIRQIIVYSPEDDLDNGVPDFDIFPKGAIAVDEGGVGLDDTGRDGKVDDKDRHFMSTPIDNGVFSKIGTIFVFKAQGLWENAQKYSTELSLDTAVPMYGALDSMHDIMTGAGTSVMSGENLMKVTYKNFVHIGF